MWVPFPEPVLSPNSAVSESFSEFDGFAPVYTWSLLEDSRLFGPSPWKILATTYETNDV